VSYRLDLQIQPSGQGDEYDRGLFEGTLSYLSESKALSNAAARHHTIGISRRAKEEWQVALGHDGEWSTLQPTLQAAIEAAEGKDFN
jgi:hypothetical protein